MNKTFLKTLMSICVATVVVFIVAQACYAGAGSRFVGNNSGCLSASGGRDGIDSVKYACGKASCDTAGNPPGSEKTECLADGGQNGCALWIGAISDSVGTVINVTGTGVATIAYWGMCTDRADTTRNITVSNDNDSINDHMNLTRGLWARPSAIGTTLDVAKFIEGLTGTDMGDGCSKKYTRTVNVARTHSDGGSADNMDQEVAIVVYDNETCTAPPPPPDSCDAWTPDSYYLSGDYKGTTSIEMKIKNTSMASRPSLGGSYDKYTDWGDSKIYAMPTDQIDWRTCYYPGVQTTKDTEVSSINWENWGNYNELRNDACQNEDVSYQPLYTATSLVGHTWQNQYLHSGDGIKTSPWGCGGDLLVCNTLGDNSTLHSDGQKVTATGDAGKTFTEKSETGEPVSASIAFSNKEVEVWSDTCACCGSGDTSCTETNDCECCLCKNTYTSDLANADVGWGPRSDAISVDVPYNFINSTAVTVSASYVYAGWKVDVDSVTTTVGQRTNYETSATYATQVPNAKVKLFGYASGSASGSFSDSSNASCSDLSSAYKHGQCLEFNSTSTETLNAGGSLGGVTESHLSLEREYNVYDVTAGDYMCFVSAVYPAESNGDTDMSGGNGKWRYSAPACVVVAKKPSFQVWGSDMYSNSTIDNKPEVKRNVFNGYKGSVGSNFKITGDPGTTIYSSWVEEGLLLGGSATTENLASGAGTGKTSDASKANAGNSGDFCNYGTALTFSNVSGASGCASSYGMNLHPNDSEREVLIDYWTGGGTKPGADSGVGIDMDLSDVASKGASIPSGSGATIRYIEPTGDLSIHGTIGKHTTVLIKSNNLVTITGNVVYENSYSSGDTLREIPKLVIYASNVDIQCGVGEVDAIIITKEGGKVRTCSDAPSDDSATARSNQLRIFGVVMADEIDLGRNYGAAAWGGSGYSNGQGEAAEVFDFDSSILLWSEFMASSSETDTLQQVYQVEIAPRY